MEANITNCYITSARKRPYIKISTFIDTFRGKIWNFTDTNLLGAGKKPARIYEKPARIFLAGDGYALNRQKAGKKKNEKNTD